MGRPQRVIGIFVLHEKLTLQKILRAIMVTGGVVGLSL